MLTAGFLVLLWAVYEVWVSDWVSARLQSQASEDLREGWAEEALDAAVTAPVTVPVPPEGAAFAFLHFPALGSDWSRAIVEGTDPSDLDRGPGHYVGTAMPGQSGNFALAGHRVGRGSSFLEIDELRPGDAVVVETTEHWFVYRVLGDPATGDYTASPTGIPGQQIVAPTDIEVISPTPNGPAHGAATGAYLTLTTCHPEFSARQRLVVHAALDGAAIPKAEAPEGPAALHEMRAQKKEG